MAFCVTKVQRIHDHADIRGIFPALAQVRDFQPDAVVLDIGLPGMNGYEVCRQLREMPGHEDTLVIAVSGYGQLDDVDRGREAGVTHYLTKPADPDELAHLLRSQS